MRPVHLSDLHHAACALRALPAGQQADRMHAALLAAETADRYRKRLRKSHPTYGHGTLSSAFGAVDVPKRCDRAYLQAMQIVVSALIRKSA